LISTHKKYNCEERKATLPVPPPINPHINVKYRPGFLRPHPSATPARATVAYAVVRPQRARRPPSLLPFPVDGGIVRALRLGVVVERELLPRRDVFCRNEREEGDALLRVESALATLVLEDDNGRKKAGRKEGRRREGRHTPQGEYHKRQAARAGSGRTNDFGMSVSYPSLLSRRR
jgi:hypothetical protein